MLQAGDATDACLGMTGAACLLSCTLTCWLCYYRRLREQTRPWLLPIPTTVERHWWSCIACGGRSKKGRNGCMVLARLETRSAARSYPRATLHKLIPRLRGRSIDRIATKSQNAMKMMIAFALVVAAAAVVVADGFTVTGEVYCDPCRAGFKTNVSTALAGAAVKLECRPFLNGPESLKADATTDANGWYRLEVDQDFQEDICEVMLVKSPDPACSEIDMFRDRARIPLTKNNGIKMNGIRYGNPIAFLRKEPLKECGAILQQYDLKDAPETP